MPHIAETMPHQGVGWGGGGGGIMGGWFALQTRPEHHAWIPCWNSIPKGWLCIGQVCLNQQWGRRCVQGGGGGGGATGYTGPKHMTPGLRTGPAHRACAPGLCTGPAHGCAILRIGAWAYWACVTWYWACVTWYWSCVNWY